MARRLDKSFVIFESIENPDHDRCVDLFQRPDATFGFEEFRKDVEDGGYWTAVNYFSDAIFQTREGAVAAAKKAVLWLEDEIS
jgi:hypothetical protein